MNLEEYHITKASGSKYQIELLAVFCGPDLSVTICGGTGYHVGAIALGCARPIKEGRERSATVSVICAYEHKDDEAARQSAKISGNNPEMQGVCGSRHTRGQCIRR